MLEFQAAARMVLLFFHYWYDSGMPNPEQEFAKHQETQRHENAVNEAKRKLDEAELVYRRSLEEYQRMLEESKKYNSEMVDEAVGEYGEHLKKEADNAWEEERYDEAFDLIEKMRGLEKNYPAPEKKALTSAEDRFVMEESLAFYNALPENLKEGNLQFVANQFWKMALLMKEQGEPIDDAAIEKISNTVAGRLQASPASREIARAPFPGWNKNKKK